jgi:hypothetical protein
MLSRILLSLLISFLCGFILPTTSVFAQVFPIERFTNESSLDPPERLDAIRFMQARILQPDTGYYLVRDIHVLMTRDNPLSVFAGLVTFQTGGSVDKMFDLDDPTSVQGYYIVLLTRSDGGFQIIDELPVTPQELADNLGFENIPPPPDFITDPAGLDYSGALFNSTNPTTVTWRDNLAESPTPRWRWIDMTGDDLLDSVLDIEGFENPSVNYYIILVATGDGFEEGFRAWGHNTDFSECTGTNGIAIQADRYDLNESGVEMLSWRDHYRWVNDRFLLANSEYASDYANLITSLQKLAIDALDSETSEGSRWLGLARYSINATRYLEGLGTPFEYYFNLARIAEYQENPAQAASWRLKVLDYIDAEYDTQDLVDPASLDPDVQAILFAYEEWRDEVYAASESED